MKSSFNPLAHFSTKSRDLTPYEWFEVIVAMFLTILVSLVTLFACARLGVEVYELVIFDDDLMDPAHYVTIFAMILTVLIALEFNHTIVQIIERKQSIFQVRIVVQIAILAIVRKIIILDLGKTQPITLIGLAALMFGLAALYFVLRQRELSLQDKEAEISS